MEYHNIPPVFDSNSEILILGSFPSVKSREAEFFYAHPQNRFWRLISDIYNSPCPVTVSQKKELLLSNRIALWDVIKSCDIKGSSDSSIKNAVPNDIKYLLDNSNITRIFCNGALSYKLYNKYIFDVTNISAFKLPSSSPANATLSYENLRKLWTEILN